MGMVVIVAMVVMLRGGLREERYSETWDASWSNKNWLNSDSIPKNDLLVIMYLWWMGECRGTA